MEASSDLIKENDDLLKVCLLYEVRRKIPIFHSYRNFCKIVGQDVMDYKDFEFWYYRFYHGQMDFDYDRSADPEPKTLVEIPVVLMTKIARYLDPVERTHLRSMNHAIKAVADTFPPAFEKINITVSRTSMHWTLNKQRFSCYKKTTGCTLYKPNSKGEESEECHIKKSLEYLAPVLKMPNIQVNHFSLTIYNETLKPNDLLPTPFNPKSVFIYGRSANEVVQFLSAMTPGHLESISLDGSFLREDESYRMIFETDQLKQAKSVEVKSNWKAFTLEDLTIFSHLKSFKCQVRTNNVFEDLSRIRDIISNFEELESCELSFSSGLDRFPMRGFAGALGEEIPIGPLKKSEHLTITHRYRIPDSNESLEFKMKEDGHRCLINIVKIR
ncbi:unnamed protein product [Caenorhabditis nigoni]